MAHDSMSALRWNWDAPLLISPHNNKRLYFAANRLFRSENRGDKWKCISPDLSQQIDRNKLPVMGRVQSADAVMKNKSTTMYGNIVALDESPLQEDLLYVGSDDGLIHVTENAGGHWKTYSNFKGVPKNTYVNALIASKHNVNTVYAVFNNHKNGDFKPYVMVSNDKGKNWKSISANLPTRGTVYDLAEDHVQSDLLFVGTEFGVFFSYNGGEEWKQLKAGLPTIAVKDIEIQERENDLVLATFGRSFYVLDDYSSLRSLKSNMDSKAAIFEIKKSLMYMDARPLGLRGKGSQGESHYTAKNPPLGAVITYFLNDTLKTNKQNRRKAEKQLIKKNEDVKYPTLEELRAEDREEKPYLIFTIYDKDGNEVRKMVERPSLGLNRIVWDFRMTPQSNIKLKSSQPGRYGEANAGPLALPGTYSVSLQKVVNGVATTMVDETPFECEWLEQLTLPAESKEELLAFQQKVDRLRKAIDAAGEVLEEDKKRLKFIGAAIKSYPGLDVQFISKVKSLDKIRDDIVVKMYGDPSLSKRDIEQNESIASKVGIVIWNMWRNRSKPTETNKMLYDNASTGFEKVISQMTSLDKEIKVLEKYLEDNDVPFTPGRGLIMKWNKE